LTLAIAIAFVLLSTVFSPFVALFRGASNASPATVETAWATEEMPFGVLGENITLEPGSPIDFVSIHRDGNNMLSLNGSVSHQGRSSVFRLQHGTSKGYANEGGALPTDDHKLYPDPRTWADIDNGTCFNDTMEPLFEWQERAPHAILLGAMKGGTHALSEYLWDHPFVARPKGRGYELHFFDSKNLKRTSNGIPQKENQYSYAIQFRRMYPAFFGADNNVVTIHDSPRYLLWSDRIPDAILCVTPWTKLMAVLRDPVERAISHYRFQDDGK
jgi:hypothetical protein